MTDREQRLFVPGYAARGSLYGKGLPPGWTALEPPSLRLTRGRFSNYRQWLVRELAQRDGVDVLAGHSMGAALAVAAAADRPQLVDRLILLSPAGLPLSKPLRESARDTIRHTFQGLYPPAEAWAAFASGAMHPLALMRLGREVHDLDLRAEMARVRSAAIPAIVVGCASDTVTPPAICRAVAEHLGAEYRELGPPRNHVWMLTAWAEFAELLEPQKAS